MWLIGNKDKHRVKLTQDKKQRLCGIIKGERIRRASQLIRNLLQKYSTYKGKLIPQGNIVCRKSIKHITLPKIPRKTGNGSSLLLQVEDGLSQFY